MATGPEAGGTAAGEMIAGLPPLILSERAGLVRAALGGAGVEAPEPPQAMLLTSLVNIRWLTGFSGSAAMVVLTPEDLVLITDGRYATQAPAEVSAAEVPGRVVIGYSGEEQRKAAAEAVGGAERVALESGNVTWSQLKAFGKWFPDAELLPVDGLVEGLRRRKTPAEVERMGAAAAIADEALAEVLPLLPDEPAEIELASEIDHRMRRKGASGSAFETIAAGGPNSALPHARPSARRIREGETVVLDFGAIVDGYRSDMTRTVCFGDLLEKQRRMYDIVLEAQLAGLSAVAAGVGCAEVDAAARRVIEEAGWGGHFMHSTGHGVGLDIHERPALGSRSDDVLLEGEVVTVEPGVYIEGIGGVRIEDTVLVTSGGCRRLTLSPKSP